MVASNDRIPFVPIFVRFLPFSLSRLCDETGCLLSRGEPGERPEQKLTLILLPHSAPQVVDTRKLQHDLYVLDLASLRWTNITRAASTDGPSPRYFHSADVWNDHLVLYGAFWARSRTRGSLD